MVPVAGIGRSRLVGRLVAVVIEAVADLDDGRRDGRNSVVAVGAVGDEAGGTAAGDGRLRQVAVPIRVGIAVPGDGVGGAVFICLGIAVVVDAVADLSGVRIDGRVPVVAVGGRVGGDAFSGIVAVDVGDGVDRLACCTEEAVIVGIQEAELDVVAVLVEAVAHHLGRAGVDRCVVVRAIAGQRDEAGPRDAVEGLTGGARTVAVAVVVGEVGGEDHVVVHGAAAVVVDEVAGLDGAGPDIAVRVVAIAADQHIAEQLVAARYGGKVVAEAVAVGVEVADDGVGGLFVGLAIAVIVEVITDLRRGLESGDAGDGPLAGRTAERADAGEAGVAVFVEAGRVVVNLGVAVIVDAVAELRGGAVDGGTAVITINAETGGAKAILVAVRVDADIGRDADGEGVGGAIYPHAIEGLRAVAIADAGLRTDALVGVFGRRVTDARGAILVRGAGLANR